ncbi:MAG TPA: hypothetical protein VGP77_16100, partial [Vicinamibacterales bacterium]|nr:hypothetical protein [Vicinamibacterales bacterium]
MQLGVSVALYFGQVRGSPALLVLQQREREDQIVTARATSMSSWRLFDSSGKLAVMFVIELNYKVDLAEIDAH